MKYLGVIIDDKLSYRNGVCMSLDRGTCKLSQRRKQINSVYQLMALRDYFVFRTTSDEAVLVKSVMILVDILVNQMSVLHHARRRGTQNAGMWQGQNGMIPGIADRGFSNSRWTHKLIRNIRIWFTGKHGETNYCIT